MRSLTDRKLTNCFALQCPCFYVLSKASLPLLEAFMDEKKVNRRTEPPTTCESGVKASLNLTLFPPGGSDRRERRSGKLRLLAHSAVSSGFILSVKRSRRPAETPPPFNFTFFQEAGLRSSGFGTFRRWKLAFLYRVRPLLQGETSGRRVLHGVGGTEEDKNYRGIFRTTQDELRERSNKDCLMNRDSKRISKY